MYGRGPKGNGKHKAEQEQSQEKQDKQEDFGCTLFSFHFISTSILDVSFLSVHDGPINFADSSSLIEFQNSIEKDCESKRYHQDNH